jgi:hypothetical protein
MSSLRVRGAELPTHDKKHDAWLKFARDILDVPLGRSKHDLVAFRNIAHFEYPALVRIIDDYLMLAENSDSTVQASKPAPRKKARSAHLFDLLREKTFFPQNRDLSEFASRVLPGIRTARFDKMSRGDIAARIIEHLESTDPKTRDALEASMRDALAVMAGRRPRDIERQSFLSKWERIIKGIEL